MEQSEQAKIVAIMKDNCLHAYLATGDGDQPRVRPVSPIVEDDMSIWVATNSSSRKVKQIGQNPKVCLAFTQLPDGDKCATVVGRAEIVPDLATKRRIWGLAPYDIALHFPDGPGSQLFCLLRIKPDLIEWWETWESGRHTFIPAGQ